MKPEWTNVGNITVVQAALAVTARDNVSVDALASTKTAIYTVSAGAKSAEVRFITPADADAWVVEMYAARGKYDHYTRVATLTLTGGTQKHSTNKVFVDTLAATNEKWYGTFVTAKEVCSAVNDIARYYWQNNLYTRFLFIASTIEAGKTLEVEVAEMNESY